MILDNIEKIALGRSLAYEEACALMNEITSGTVSDVQIAAVLMGLRVKGETVEEIAGFASVMKERSSRISPKVDGRLTDTCGTGGAPLKTINISTISAFVAAGAGICIAKHGNRSVTSICGSADVLEALGANIMLKPGQVEQVIERVGIGFLFAPAFHPSMKYALGPRKELRIRTVFNVLGPLTNPADAKGHVLGVFAEELVPKIAGALHRLGIEKGLVVFGKGGMDELSTLGETVVAEVTQDSGIRTYEVVPEDFGFRRCRASDIAGVGPSESAEITHSILRGCKGPMRDVVVLNAAAAIYVGGRADSVKDGVHIAAASIDSGKAARKLDDFITATKAF